MFSAIIKERKKAQESGAPRANDMLQVGMWLVSSPTSFFIWMGAGAGSIEVP